MRELLIDTLAYLSPVNALDGLGTEDAERRLDGANHSIAEIVAHLEFWQSWFCERCEGVAAPMVASARQGWPAVAPGSWPAVRGRFLEGLERAAALGDDATRLDAPIVPAIEFPPIAGYTVRDALVHVAQHNAHHLGQIILLRQLMHVWPPPSGSWTW
ncbi:MAG TPA: DinB family protein [Vicinamibacterales bacterium]|nr:DinB family protein [Vicinamibacterales bacterium]